MSARGIDPKKVDLMTDGKVQIYKGKVLIVDGKVALCDGDCCEGVSLPCCSDLAPLRYEAVISGIPSWPFGCVEDECPVLNDTWILTWDGGSRNWRYIFDPPLCASGEPITQLVLTISAAENPLYCTFRLTFYNQCSYSTGVPKPIACAKIKNLVLPTHYLCTNPLICANLGNWNVAISALAP